MAQETTRVAGSQGGSEFLLRSVAMIPMRVEQMRLCVEKEAHSVSPLPLDGFCRASGPCYTFLFFRIVAIDYYMAKPIQGLDVCFSPLHGSTVEQVPVIRYVFTSHLS